MKRCGAFTTRARTWTTLLKRAAVTKVPMFSLAKVLVQFSTMMQFEKVHPLQSGLIRMKHPSEQRPGLAPENVLTFYARYLRDLIVRNAAFLRTTRWVLMTAWRIAHDPNRHIVCGHGLAAGRER